MFYSTSTTFEHAKSLINMDESFYPMEIVTMPSASVTVQGR